MFVAEYCILLAMAGKLYDGEGVYMVTVGVMCPPLLPAAANGKKVVAK